MSTDTTTQPTTTNESTTPVAPAAPVNLQVTDIVNGTILLKVAIERGTFKAEEIAEVGAVYGKLSAFVQYVQATAAAESQAAAQAAAPAAEALESETKKTKKTKKAK